MNPTLRRLWRLVAVGGTVAVGITTHDAGFTFLTLAGGLALPRILGLSGHHHRSAVPCTGGHGRGRLEARLKDWHGQAHAEVPATPPAAGAA